MSALANLMLLPLRAAYAAITRTRLAAYQRGLLPVTQLSVPVISVGNMTVGGTGKTPLVEWVSRTLAFEGRNVCVLTRGYGRAHPSTRVLVSDGSKILANAGEAGDEPFLLAQNLKGLAAVISDPDRVAAGQWAVEKLGANVLVLDDGFQHLKLARNLNIVTIDATNPWGGGHLLPQGRLREPRSGLSRADCVVVTRAADSVKLISLRRQIQQLSDACHIFISRMHTRSIRRMFSESPEVLTSLPQPVAAFCGVGNPKSFFDHLRFEGHNLVFTRAFPDHHTYDQTDIESLIREAQELGAQSLITTAKDAVKLQPLSFKITCHVLEIGISIEEEDKLVEMIAAAL